MHHIQSFILLILFTHLLISGKSQAITGWLMSVNTYKLNGSISAYFDGQLRSTDELAHIQTVILRPGIQYNFNKTINATLGYALVDSRRTIAGVSGYAPEHRIWEQLQVMHPVAFTMLNHRLRLEQRFLTKFVLLNNSVRKEGNSYTSRVRYFFRDIIPFNGMKNFNKGVFAALQNEVFINISNKTTVNGKYFDQNRAYTALGFRFSPKFDLEAGYLNQYISGQSKSFTNNHNIQVASYIRL